MNKLILIIIALVILVGAGFFVWQSGVFSYSEPEPAKIPEGIILFYGDGCPHCEVVDEFVEQNNIKEKVQFSELEVWYNKGNQAVLLQVAQKCQINTGQVGVPFLYDGSNCIIGDQPIIEFFRQKAGIQ